MDGSLAVAVTLTGTFTGRCPTKFCLPYVGTGNKIKDIRPTQVSQKYGYAYSHSADLANLIC